MDEDTDDDADVDGVAVAGAADRVDRRGAGSVGPVRTLQFFMLAFVVDTQMLSWSRPKSIWQA